MLRIVRCTIAIVTSSPPSTRFIHSSDWQLGMTRAFLNDEAAARFSQARVDAITTLGAMASEHSAQFIVVAGDVFESNQLSRQTLLRTLDALEALPVPVFLLPGNHDPLDGSSIFASELFQRASPHIIVLQDMSEVAVPGAPGLEVVGAPWRSKRPSTDLCAQMASALQPAAGITRIAVCHGQVDTLSPDPNRPEIISLAAAEKAIAQNKFHYLALGDRHSLTPLGSSGRIHYSGAPVATAFDETDPNQALLVELAGDQHCQVTGLKVGSWNFISEARELNTEHDLNDFERWLGALPGKENTIVKVAFTGSVNLQTRARLDTIMEQQSALFASLRLRRRTTRLALLPDELDVDSVSLSGYALEAWQQLVRMSQAQATGPDPDNSPFDQPDLVQTAQDALRLFYRLGAAKGP